MTNLMSNGGAGNNTLPAQMPLHYVMGANNAPNVMPHQMHSPNNRQMNAFIRDAQTQQSLRMNQMMAPSMPNIAHSAAAYQGNISSSQSMQNVNMIHPNYYVQQNQNAIAMNYPNGYALAEGQQQPQSQQQQPQQQQTLDLADLNRRRAQQRPPEMMPMYSLDINVQNSMPNLTGSALLSPTINPNDHQAFRAAAALNKSHASQPGINYIHNSPGKQLPPTAPKPQMNRQSMHAQYKEEHSPPLPPSATHPLYKTTPTNGHAYNSLPPTATSKGFSSNPWEREEREKEQEMRRGQRIEKKIIELTKLPHRAPQQEEQLQKLIFDRKFELRAEEEEGMEDDNDATYVKDNIHERIRLAQNLQNQISTPVTSLRQVDMKTNIVSTVPSSMQQKGEANESAATNSMQPKSILKHNARSDRNPSNSNPSSPSKQGKTTSFADDRQNNENGTASMSNVVRDLSNLSFSDYETNSTSTTTSTFTVQEIRKETIETSVDFISSNGGPPPPPERNSSFAVMSQKQQTLRNNNIPSGNNVGSAVSPVATASPIASSSSESIINQLMKNPNVTTTSSPAPTTVAASLNSPNNNSAQVTTPTQSVTNLSLSALMANRDNKRVSFHDEDNNPVFDQTIEDPNVSFIVNAQNCVMTHDRENGK